MEVTIPEVGDRVCFANQLRTYAYEPHRCEQAGSVDAAQTGTVQEIIDKGEDPQGFALIDVVVRLDEKREDKTVLVYAAPPELEVLGRWTG